MSDQLKKAVELARARTMTSAEREEQLRNFAAGNVGLENERVTRAVVDEAARRKAVLDELTAEAEKLGLGY